MTDLTPYQNNSEFLRQTVDQLIKDFRYSGIEISFSGNPSSAYSELFNQVEPCLSKIMGTEKYFSLLYRIDLSEKQVSNACRNQPQREASHVVTDLILKRELQKVVMRKAAGKKANTGFF